MGFATIIAILAFGIALVALWLVSDVIKKVETQNEKFIRAHIASIREEIRLTDNQLAKMDKAVKALVEGTELTDKRINGQTTDLEGTRARIAKVAEDLDLLDRSIPQRFRARVVPPADPAAKKTAAKPKPTVQ